MKESDKAALLETIARLQSGANNKFDNGTSPVKLSVGYISPRSRTVMHDGILIIEAPPAVLKGITEWVQSTNNGDPDALNITMAVIDGGLLVS